MDSFKHSSSPGDRARDNCTSIIIRCNSNVDDHSSRPESEDLPNETIRHADDGPPRHPDEGEGANFSCVDSSDAVAGCPLAIIEC